MKILSWSTRIQKFGKLLRRYRFQLPSSESTIGPIKVGETFELDVEPGVKYEVVNLEGTLENGVKLRK